ncbi:MAG TPA: hypothetical protein VFZ59_03750 [Verrucomicrobiae bacterium]|nr:hypothetical protein [Verrucomicrobiae bacterium]
MATSIVQRSRLKLWLSVFGLLVSGLRSVAADQFIVLNVSEGRVADSFAEITKALTNQPTSKVRVGIASIFSYLQHPRERVAANLREFLRLARETDTPIVVQLDGEQWWGNRPDLWNWWDTNRAGYSPANRANVEWTNWSSDSAIKIAWRNWGRQLRVLPPPNLMSPRYREACHEEMRALIPIVFDWWRELPPNQKELLIGIKVGWESSIGVNAWYYPGGNDLLSQPESNDPVHGLKAEQPPARGVVQIGYAAVKTAGIRTDGNITEADLAEVVRRHLYDLCREANQLGVPREKLFTHVAGWKEGELLYATAVNSLSCPGWSFYRHAADPSGDIGVPAALKASDAPHWAAVEWLYQGKNETAAWKNALAATLADPRCRYLCIYNWSGVRSNRAALEAIRQMIR